MKLNLYACGGTGVNIARRVADLDVNIIYVDTSASNLKNTEGNVFLIDGMDGAGKHMAATYEEFKPVVSDVLLKFPPSRNVNIVLGSLSGGSGAVIAPMVASQLVDDGYNTIAIGTVSESSTAEINNSLKSLRSYRGRSNAIGKAISIYLVEGHTRNDVDQNVLHFISLISLLVDKKHTAEFDTADLRSFLFFDRVTANQPTVSVLEIGPNEPVTPEKGTSIVGSVLLTRDPSSSLKPEYPEYAATCLVTDPTYKNDDIRINSVLGRFAMFVETLETRHREQVDRRHLNKVRDVQVTSTQDDGMCL